MKRIGTILLAGLVSASAACPAWAWASSPSDNASGQRVIAFGETQAPSEPARAKFPEKMPGKVDKKAVQSANWQMAGAFDSLILAGDESPESVTIFGAAEATPEQMEAYIQKRNPRPKLNCTLSQIVQYYYEEAGRENIRPDVALCQALKETGFFAYGGDVSPSQNNFCGLGATGNHEPGAKFLTPQLGVRAHIQHLLAYTSTKRPSVNIVDPRYEHIVKFRKDVYGKVQNWVGLNGIWAVPGTHYGQDILRLWQEAKAPDGSDATLAAAMKRVSDSPDDARAYVYRAMVYHKQGKDEESIADFTRAIELAPSAELYYNRAVLLTPTQPDGAMSDYGKAVKLDPTLGVAYYNRGMLYAQKKKYKDAIRDFERVLAIEARTADARNNIGVMNIRRKKYDDAWKDFYEAGEINTNNENIIANQEIFMRSLQQKK